MDRQVDPLISIIVPVYGTEELFDRCILSLLDQSYQNIEIIVVNDGSPGNINEIIQKYLSNPRVRFINNLKNQGLLMTRVCGSLQAKGEYIAFVDSDDYVSQDFYRVLIKKAEETGADIIIGKTVWENMGEKYVYNYHESCFQFDILIGDEIKKKYFMQETQCYSWHTIWNKLYRKNLWDKCLTEFRSVDEHIIMTEDIYFSSVLFFNAEKVTRTENEAYFYCSNEKASTNSKGISLNKYKKNIHDIHYVFNKVEKYLHRNHADTYVLNGFKKGRAHYGRMWKSLAENTFSDETRDKALTLVHKFCTDFGDQKIQHDYFFESIKTPWNGGLEYIKQEIRKSEKKYISFDIFDTLITRPFYEPADIFSLLNPIFSRLSGSTISFKKIRKDGEELARAFFGKEKGFEDISIDEIYEFIAEYYKIEKETSNQMKRTEEDLEVRFCVPRYAGRELFDFAKAIGKKVILISDMYLDRNTIERILNKNGIQGYEKLFLSCEERRLKYNGGLFRCALDELSIRSEDVIHIGDTWKSDIEGSRVAGIQNIFFPKAKEIFENRIKGCTTNRCADIASTMCSGSIKYEKVKENIGYRCMQAIVANTYFDNPYRPFNAESDFNVDPYFIGFYPVGMHLIGIAKWLSSLCKQNGYENLLFLARDGFLPMKVYEYYRKYTGSAVKIQYLQASRKAVMPILLKDKINFYQMPVEYRAHTPETLTEVLRFATDIGESDKDKILHELLKNGLSKADTFQSKDEFHGFIRFFFDNIYSPEKHNYEQQKVKMYYSQIPENSVTFDMGYSGRIQGAICEASGKTVDAAFIHEDYQTSVEMRNLYGFNISNFYDYRPEITGVMREHIFSDPTGSCIGVEENNGEIYPVYEKNKHTYPDYFVIDIIHKGTIDFTKIFLDFFGEYISVIDFSSEEVSLPFEGFLRYPCVADMHIFSASYFEDLVFGAREKINIEEFAMQYLASVGWPPKEEKKQMQQSLGMEEERILDLINHSSQLKRGIVWYILNWSFFIEKLKKNLKRFKKKISEGQKDGF